jgi:hypothetical protein
MQSGFVLGVAHFRPDVTARMRVSLRQDGKIQNESQSDGQITFRESLDTTESRARPN